MGKLVYYGKIRKIAVIGMIYTISMLLTLGFGFLWFGLFFLKTAPVHPENISMLMGIFGSIGIIFLLAIFLLIRPIKLMIRTKIDLYENGIRGSFEGQPFEMLFQDIPHLYVFGNLSLPVITYGFMKLNTLIIWFQDKNQRWITFPRSYRYDIPHVFMDYYCKTLVPIKKAQLEQGETLTFDYQPKLRPNKKSLEQSKIPQRIELTKDSFTINGEKYFIKNIKKININNQLKITFQDKSTVKFFQAGINHGLLFIRLLNELRS